MDGRGDGAVRGACPRGRVARAIAIVALIVLAAPAIDAVSAMAGGTRDAEAASAGIDAASLLEGGDADEALASIERFADSEAVAAELPAAFSDEIGLLPGARDVRVSGQVLGYVVDADCADALGALDAHMAERGWTGVPLGQVDGATFLKPAGACTWALATCTQVGSSTSVVVRFA